jgi:hypothetical protein
MNRGGRTGPVPDLQLFSRFRPARGGKLAGVSAITSILIDIGESEVKNGGSIKLIFQEKI